MSRITGRPAGSMGLRAGLLLLSFILVLSPLESATGAMSTGGQATSGQSGASAVGNAPSSPCLAPSDASSSAAAAATNASEPVSGDVLPSVMSGAAVSQGSLSSSAAVSMELVFSIRNMAQFSACLASIETPGSANYRHFLDAQTLAPYMPTPEATAAAEAFLEHAGFAVSPGPSPLVIRFSGTAKEVESAFGVKLGVFEQGSRRFYAAASDPVLPGSIAVLTEGILGLENLSVATPAETPCATGGSPACPQGLQAGYSMSSLYSGGYTGSGVNVAVVEEPGDPNPQGAINAFDSQYGLPSVTLSIVYPDGSPTSYDPGWASETAMDIEAVHTMAPGAGIVLLYDTGDLFNSIDYVAAHHLASIVSDSWGSGLPDYLLPPSVVSAYDSRLMVDAAQGLTILFASGDSGSRPGGDLGAEFPATDPNVLSVGATSLSLTGCDGTTCSGYGGETGSSISGGGFSGRFAEPSWQRSAIGAKPGRSVPDVSILGDSPGFWVYSTRSDECGTSVWPTSGWFGCAGTSLSSPLWAGFLAVSFQEGGGSLGDVDPLIYYLGSSSAYFSAFNDVTTGSNGYSAGPGWDPVTGWGSPVGDVLAYALFHPPISASVSPSAPSIDGGQSVTLTAAASRGTAPYSYQWYAGASCAAGSALSGATGQSYAASPSATASYSVLVNDSSGTPDGACAEVTVTVNGPLSASASPASLTIDSGESAALTAMPSGGTAPYAYQWYAGSSCAAGDAVQGQTSRSYSPSPTSNSTYSVLVTDSSSGSPASSSCGAAAVVVDSALTPPVISATLGTVTFAQGTSLSAVSPFGGGTPAYSCRWLQESPGSVSYSALGGAFACGTSSLPTVPTGPLVVSGTWYFELQVADGTGAAIASPPVAVLVTGLVVSCTPASPVVGSTAACRAAFDFPGAPQGGAVSWSAGAPGRLSSSSCRLAAGACSVRFTPTVANATATITAAYRGTPAYTGEFGLQVRQATTRVTLACGPRSSVARPATTVTCTARVIGYLPSGLIALSENVTGTTASTCALLGGKCAVRLTGLPPGAILIRGSYGGDGRNLQSSGTSVVTLKKSVTRTSVTCAALGVGWSSYCEVTVRGYGYPIDGENVTLAKTSGTANVTFDSPSCTVWSVGSAETCEIGIEATSSGIAILGAAYPGDQNNTASSGARALKISKGGTATAVLCVSTSLSVGLSTSCTAYVIASQVAPTGHVSWTKVGGTGAVRFSPASCSLSSYVCSTTVTITKAGPVTVKATYLGDSNYLHSSGTFTLHMGTAVPVETDPTGVAVNPSTNTVYVTDIANGTVSVISGGNNSVVANITVGLSPFGVAVNPSTNTVYVTDEESGTVSVIDGASNTVVASIAVGSFPLGVAVNPSTGEVYVANFLSGTVSVINGSTNAVVANVTVAALPIGVAVDPSTDKVYVTCSGDDTVSVIDGASNTVVASIAVGSYPFGVAVDQSTNRVYVADADESMVSVIDGSTNMVVANVTVGNMPYGIAVNPSSHMVYVSNYIDGTVSVISGTTNKVTSTVYVWYGPMGVAVDPSTGKVYVANSASNSVSVI